MKFFCLSHFHQRLRLICPLADLSVINSGDGESSGGSIVTRKPGISRRSDSLRRKPAMQPLSRIIVVVVAVDAVLVASVVAAAEGDV